MCWCEPLQSVVCCGGAPPLSVVQQLWESDDEGEHHRRTDVELPVTPVLLLLPLQELARGARSAQRAAERYENFGRDRCSSSRSEALTLPSPTAFLSSLDKKEEKLEWIAVQSDSDPRSRYGHHVAFLDPFLYMFGGMYVDEPRLAIADVSFDVHSRAWARLPLPLFPPRFDAALASYTSGDTMTLYLFGGVNESQVETKSLFRLVLPRNECVELPQEGSVPQSQYGGLMVADSSHRLFYIDGCQRGCAMVKAVREYDLATSRWRRVCSCPSLLGGRIAGMRYSSEGSVSGERRLKQFDIIGGLTDRHPELSADGEPARCLSFTFDVDSESFTFTHVVSAVNRLTFHNIALLPHGVLTLQSAMWRRGVYQEREQQHEELTSVLFGGYNEDQEAVSTVHFIGQRFRGLAEELLTWLKQQQGVFYAPALAAVEEDDLETLQALF